MERTLRLTVEYDGSEFHGWQKQPGLRTVQGELEQALATLLRHPVVVHGAGRTDRGVHAVGQVASFQTHEELPAARLQAGLNALTGGDLSVREARDAPPGFHARHSARARHYSYLLLEQPSAFWHTRALLVRTAPDVAAMNAAAAALVGDHDFARLSCRAEEETGTRTVVSYAQWEPWQRGWCFRIGAVRFLYRMVRCIVAHSLEIGWGRADPGLLERALADPTGRCQRVAPAHGLQLMAVDYSEAGDLGAGRPRCSPPACML